jgi:hypothetical protein
MIHPPIGPLELEAKQKELDKMMKKFLKNGGKIEIIPPGVTGEMYREHKLATKSKSKRKKK